MFELIIVKVKSLKFVIEVVIIIFWIDDFIKLYLESKDDKYGSYEDVVYFGVFNDWFDVFFYL